MIKPGRAPSAKDGFSRKSDGLVVSDGRAIGPGWCHRVHPFGGGLPPAGTAGCLQGLAVPGILTHPFWKPSTVPHLIVNTRLASWMLASLVTAAIAGPAEDAVRLAAVQSADDARVAAMKAGHRERLSSAFSDELRYAHSSGVVDTKASFIEVLTSGRTRYLGYEYEERKFTFPAPGIALMTGRARIKAESPTGTMDNVLSFLAVWREEEPGRWRFLAWQSCRLPPAAKP